MARVNNQLYIERREGSSWKNWWLIKASDKRGVGQIILKRISFKKELVGKKIRIKIEVINE